MDQFRGYTVVGMILVNFISSFAVIHSVFKHNDNYLSYADTIMPSFHFAVGFAYRLTILRRLPQLGRIKTYWSYLRRSFALIFVAVFFFGIGSGFREWRQFEQMPEVTREAEDSREKLADQMTARSGSLTDPKFRQSFVAQWRVYIATMLKCNMWNTLAIIGVTQLVVLPFMAAGPRVRALALVGCAVGHLLLSYWFNWGFVLGYEDNWMVKLWKTGSAVSWDGGFFGPLCWAAVMLSGSLAYDVIIGTSTRAAAAGKLLVWAVGFVVVAYPLSCLTRLYDTGYGATAYAEDPKRASSPFVPSFESVGQRSWVSLLAEPPFVAPPPTEQRLENYWMMSKRIPTLSFILCAVGLAFAFYAVFVVVCDVAGLKLGVFRTFGTNPFAAYCIHEILVNQIGRLVPLDAPLWYCLIGFGAFFGATYVCVRFLEKSQIFIRL
jgi:hypothetical protein